MFKLEEIKIQCPECGGLIKKDEHLANGVLCCNVCLKIYTEAEIRERCGL